MGGKALPTPTRRIGADEYHLISRKVQETVADVAGADARTVRAYRNKPSFGDLDLLLARDGWAADDEDGTLAELMRLFRSRASFREKNSNIISMEYRGSDDDAEGFQVDIILTPPELMDTADDYFAYNGLGNLIGKLARTLGLKYGFNGLILPHDVAGFPHPPVTLTTRTQNVHRLLGLDHDRFAQGFDELRDLFDFVAGSPMFRPAAYAPDASTNHQRHRDRKNATYLAFLDYCDGHPASHLEPLTKGYPMDTVRAHFPDVLNTLEAHRRANERQAALAEWFNGNTISEWTGLKGQELGEMIRAIRNEAGGDETLMEWGEDTVREVAERLAGQRRRPSPNPGP